MGMIGHFLHSYPQEDNWAWGRWYIIISFSSSYIQNKVKVGLFYEAEYTTKGGQWISRFWDASTYAELIETKKKYDPKIRFACRQCVKMF